MQILYSETKPHSLGIWMKNNSLNYWIKKLLQKLSIWNDVSILYIHEIKKIQACQGQAILRFIHHPLFKLPFRRCYGEVLQQKKIFLYFCGCTPQDLDRIMADCSNLFILLLWNRLRMSGKLFKFFTVFIYVFAVVSKSSSLSS